MRAQQKKNCILFLSRKLQQIKIQNIYIVLDLCSLLSNNISCLSVSLNLKPIFVIFDLVLHMLALSAVLFFAIVNSFNSIVQRENILRAFVTLVSSYTWRGCRTQLLVRYNYTLVTLCLPTAKPWKNQDFAECRLFARAQQQKNA